jgi:hypothetical protein
MWFKGRVPTYQTQGPEFTSQYCQKENIRKTDKPLARLTKEKREDNLNQK